MFAFVIWSPSRHLLFAARDPLGIKPFYYATMPGDSGFLFASEVKAFLSLPDFAPRLDRKALLQYLELGFTADAERTSLEGVRKVPPGHTLEVVDGVPRSPVRYFHAPRPDPADRRTLDERADELHGVLQQVVREHLIADVPAGLLLSGGLDSAVVAALAAKNGPLQTVTMGFAESLIDERAFGRTVAQHIGSEHREIVVSAADIMDEIDEVAWSIDDLFGDWGLFTTRLLYRKCHELGLKVVLVGEGADELFGGYGSFYEVDRKGPAAWRSFQLHRWFSGRRWGKGYFELARLMRGYLREADGDWFHAIRLYEVRNQLPNNYMMKVDKASMSVSTEARTPYLDRRVAELAMRTPREFLLANGASKLVLRRMAERHELLPHDIVWRRKFGAGIATDWIETIPQFRAFVRERVLRPGSWTDELGLRDAMTGYFDRGETGYPPPRSISLFHNLAWRLVLLELWTSKYLPGQAAA
jgi:asparagine synthase (glutamine-hydrolysing)